MNAWARFVYSEAATLDAQHPQAPSVLGDRVPVPIPRRAAGMERLVAVIGICVFVAGTVPDLMVGSDRLLTGLSLTVAGIFALQYAQRLRHAPNRLAWALSGSGLVDLLAAAPVPAALALGMPGQSARLLGVFWALKLVRFDPALELLGRVLRNERRPLTSVTTAFVVVILFASTGAYLAERRAQPDVFASIPDALWWAVTTITTTGYGDKVPLSLAGRTLGGAVMVSGIGLFALWAGILASGFAQELRRRDFLESWELVARLPLFRDLGAAAISAIARLLKVETFPRDAVIVRQGQAGDSMYFIAEGVVEVHAGECVQLGAGQFFGEMALLTGEPRNATVRALGPVRLLRLDVVEFRGLAAEQPELLRAIEAEGARRVSQRLA